MLSGNSSTRFLTILAAGALLAGVTGCGESIDSSSVKTEGVYADFFAKADGSGETTVHAGLKTGGPNSNTFLELKSGDELIFHNQSMTYTPDPKNVFDQFTVYEKNISADAAGEQFRIEFKRANGTSAPQSTTTLPEKFTISSPTSSDSFSRANDDVEVTVSKADSDADQTLIVSGNCTPTVWSKDFSGTTVKIPAGTLEEFDSGSGNQPDTCQMDLTVRFVQSGSVDPAYDSGVFRGIQERKGSFESKP